MSLLAIVPARSGSKGLPGKNTRLFAGHPLMAHSLLFARLCPEIDRIVVSTDSEEIASLAVRYGAEAPFLRPSELAADDTPLWPVLRHALAAVEAAGSKPYDFVALLDPTSPARLPSDVSGALSKLVARPEAAGVIAVSKPSFNPVWHSVVEREGWMEDLYDGAVAITRRQDAPVVYRINGALYIWRSDFLRNNPEGWRAQGSHVLFEIPEVRAFSIDDLVQFRTAELLVQHGLLEFPWLTLQA